MAVSAHAGLSTVLVGLFVFIYRVSEWMLALVWEIDASRTVQARLAVAEERLRGGCAGSSQMPCRWP